MAVGSAVGATTMGVDPGVTSGVGLGDGATVGRRCRRGMRRRWLRGRGRRRRWRGLDHAKRRRRLCRGRSDRGDGGRWSRCRMALQHLLGDAGEEVRGSEHERGTQEGHRGDGRGQGARGAEGTADDLDAQLGQPGAVLVAAQAVRDRGRQLALLEARRRLDRGQGGQEFGQSRDAAQARGAGGAGADMLGERRGVRGREALGHERVDQFLGSRTDDHVYRKPQCPRKVACAGGSTFVMGRPEDAGGTRPLALPIATGRHGVCQKPGVEGLSG